MDADGTHQVGMNQKGNGTDLASDVRYCASCGTAVSPEPPPPVSGTTPKHSGSNPFGIRPFDAKEAAKLVLSLFMLSYVITNMIPDLWHVLSN